MVEMKGLEEDPGLEKVPGGGMGYPPPDDANQRRSNSKRDVIDNLCTSVNQDLLISKTFYFFFFSAFGSLFPLLAVYFKQMGMNPTQSGLLIGIRPFVEFLAAPLWGSVADRSRKGKIMLLFSLLSWIVFTLALAFIQPPASSCVVFNATHHVLFVPESDRSKRSIPDAAPYPAEEEDLRESKEGRESTSEMNLTMDWASHPEDELIGRWILETRSRRNEYRAIQDDDENSRHKLPPNYVVGKSPNSVEYTLNYNQDRHTSYISPPFSSIVYKWEDVQEVFFLLILLVVLGELFSAPAITLADSATLSYLADNTDNYGKQRMFGSLGWGLAMFFVGIALDHSTAFPDHPCGPHERERNYTICFATFSVLMGCAFIAATQFRFDYDVIDDQIPMKPVQNGPGQPANVGQLPTFLADGLVTDDVPLPACAPKNTAAAAGGTKSTVFAQTTRKLPEWLTVLRTFATLRYGAFLYVTWFMGFGIGLVFTFLFWHLQDLGGTPTLFGVASVINHISEIFAYFFSFKFIRKIGHTKVLCIGLIGNICRFLYISWLHDPWWVLPFEFVQAENTGTRPITEVKLLWERSVPARVTTREHRVQLAKKLLRTRHPHRSLYYGVLSWQPPIRPLWQAAASGGITHAAVWAACCSYITQATPANLRSSAQGVLQGLHHGLGRGCGAVIGGIFVNYFGTQVTFRGYGFASLIVLILFVFINYYRRDKGFASFNDEQEPDTVMEETSHLAPHGVPSNPMARSLSKQNLGDPRSAGGNADDYGTANPGSNTAGGYLGVPNAGGGYGGDGSNYSADFNMNTTSNGGYALTRRALAAAFNPKGILAAAASPEAIFEYDFIRRDFQAYNEVTMLAADSKTTESKSVAVPKHHLLTAPAPKTKLFTPQPEAQEDLEYDW